MMGYILGLGGSNHDFSACILKDGQLLVAIEDERIQRIKRGDSSYSAKPGFDSIKYCLESLNLNLNDIDHVYCVDDLEMPVNLFDKYEGSVTFLNHHLCHASSAYFSSNFEESALMVLDGHGSVLGEDAQNWHLETMSYGRVKGTKLEMLNHQQGLQRKSSSVWRYIVSNSVGWFYRLISNYCGFTGAAEGKAMGLASYGSPIYKDNLLEFCSYDSTGKFLFDPYNGIQDYLRKLTELSPESFSLRADLTASAQAVFEDVVITFAKFIKQETNSKNLSFSGGCALNSVANAKIKSEAGFENIFIYPAAGDNGLSIGAALYGYFSNVNTKPTKKQNWQARNVYLGKEYSKKEITETLSNSPFHFEFIGEDTDLIANKIYQGNVIACWRQRAEIGPRALGHRSILASPFLSSTKDHINLNIKARETFRPLAPIVILEKSETYFKMSEESPYMLGVYDVREKYKDKLSTITHIDGTARTQTIRKEDEPFIHKLLCSFETLSGFPILTNTSLNGKDEPIVESPLDALNFFGNSNINYLYLDGYWVSKYTTYSEISPLSIR